MTSMNETVSAKISERGNIAKSMTSEDTANVDRWPPLQRGSVMNLQLQNFELYNKTLKDWSLIDCEQPLFFFRFSKGSARARER